MSGVGSKPMRTGFRLLSLAPGESPMRRSQTCKAGSRHCRHLQHVGAPRPAFLGAPAGRTRGRRELGGGLGVVFAIVACSARALQGYGSTDEVMRNASLFEQLA